VEKPVIYYVDDEPHFLDSVREELRRRYAADYEVCGQRSPAEALKHLEELKQAGREVAVLLADCWMPEMDGSEFLLHARTLFPSARRGLLVKRRSV
jgi:thioredoxin reductase (NADPH)